MSHYKYKEKRFLEIPDGRVLPLVYIADSSITQTGYTSNGRRYEFHPYHWALDTMGLNNSLFVDKKEFANAVMSDIQKQMEHSREFEEKYGNGNQTIPMNSVTYYGNRYRGNRTYKAMKSFYSTLHTIKAERFLFQNPMEIEISLYDKKKYGTIESTKLNVNDLDSLYKADSKYQEMNSKTNSTTGICIGIQLGLQIL